MYDTTKPYLQEIERMVRRTWDTPYIYADDSGVQQKAPVEIEFRHTDGIGTKGVHHWKQRTFKASARDALAMNLNDFALARATPFEICDHIFLPRDDNEAVLAIVSYLVADCIEYDIAITAGETAIHDNLNGLEISITMLGAKRSLAPNQFEDGDLLIGIRSSGLHSNGFTKIHEVFGDEQRPEFTVPTLVYLGQISLIEQSCEIHGMTHITGGAFTKIKRFLGALDAYIFRNHHIDPHPIFWELVRKGVSEEEMYRTFNCGIGFIIGVDSSAVNTCLSILRKEFCADVIGMIKKGTGNVHIQSAFSSREFVF